MSENHAKALPSRRVRFSTEEYVTASSGPEVSENATDDILGPPDIRNLSLETTRTAPGGQASHDTSDSPNRQCDACADMLRTCLPLDLGQMRPDSIPIDRSKSRNTAPDYKYENNLSVHTIEQRSDDCEFCNLLLTVCRGTDGIFLYQSKAYEDDSFNPVRPYDENGVSDHEAAHIMYGRRKRANMKIRVMFTQSQSHQQNSKLAIRLQLELWTQKRESISYGQPLIEIEKMLPVFFFDDVPKTTWSMNTGIDHDFRLGPSEKLRMISSWIETQMRAPASTMTDYPTRLLYFSARDRVRLVQYQDLIQDEQKPTLATSHDVSHVPRIPYAALSHRWGTSDHLTATTQNWLELQDDVPVWKLPKTFRDAILLTQQLGFRYLWIDALCILQDSSSDWFYESERMGDIFMNAAFTIAVHSTRDDSEGFLRDALSKRPAVTHHFGTGAIGLCLPPDFEYDVTSSGLSRRAWVLQERFLSERTIHFTSGQVYLESEDGILCEDGTLTRPEAAYSSKQDQNYRTKSASRRLYSPHELLELRRIMNFSTTTVLSSFEGRPLVILDEAGPERTTLEWLNLVEMYSQCSLTYEADKLIAISGIARKIQNTTQQTWCAGLWADYICQGLLWSPTSSEITAPSFERAPSWSWAAWDGLIQFPAEIWDPSFHPRCSFVAVHKHGLEQQASTWLDDQGTLTLRGRLYSFSESRFGGCVSLGPGPPRRGILDDLQNATWKNYLLGHGIYSLTDEETFEDNSSLKRRRSKPYGWAVFDHMHTQLSYSDLRNRDNPTYSHDKPECFLILGTCFVDDRTMCLGLILARSNARGEETYKRLGIGHVDMRKTWPDINEEEDVFAEKSLVTINIA